jgi:phosphoribosylanthranilate isomerase
VKVRRTRVKVCGLCSAADARAAVLAGADAVGVILVPESLRHVDADEAASILRDVPPLVARVGVFVDSPADEVVAAVHALGLTAVQLHGDESPAFCASMPVPVIKAFRVGEGFDPAVMEAYRDVVASVLLDTLVKGVSGGSGRAFAWETLPALPAIAPVVVAGGLRPSNVAAAIRALRPFGVDVSSGVEEVARHKDKNRLAAFVAAVRAADEIGEASS